LVQHSFVDYKLAHPEQLEYLVPTIETKAAYECRPVSNRLLTANEYSLAKQLGPRGYAFDLSADVSTEQLDGEILKRKMEVIPAKAILERFPGTIYSSKNRCMYVAFK
jgi:hypothetical protein